MKIEEHKQSEALWKWLHANPSREIRHWPGFKKTRAVVEAPNRFGIYCNFYACSGCPLKHKTVRFMESHYDKDLCLGGLLIRWYLETTNNKRKLSKIILLLHEWVVAENFYNYGTELSRYIIAEIRVTTLKWWGEYLRTNTLD